MTAERYTVVFTGLFDGKKPGEYYYLTMSEYPTEVAGYELHNGRPAYRKFGREIELRELPVTHRALVLDIYARLWGI